MLLILYYICNYYNMLHLLYIFYVVVVSYKYFTYGDIRAAIYFCFILLCISNILAQCMVCMYLIGAYCCDVGWMDCTIHGIVQYEDKNCYVTTAT